MSDDNLPYFLKGRRIFEAPITKENPNGTRSITMGFCICEVDPHVEPQALLDILNGAVATEAKLARAMLTLYRAETGTSFSNVDNDNPNGTFAKHHCMLCDAETALGEPETTPIPHKPDCILFGYEPPMEPA